MRARSLFNRSSRRPADHRTRLARRRSAIAATLGLLAAAMAGCGLALETSEPDREAPPLTIVRADDESRRIDESAIRTPVTAAPPETTEPTQPTQGDATTTLPPPPGSPTTTTLPPIPDQHPDTVCEGFRQWALALRSAVTLRDDPAAYASATAAKFRAVMADFQSLPSDRWEPMIEVMRRTAEDLDRAKTEEEVIAVLAPFMEVSGEMAQAVRPVVGYVQFNCPHLLSL